MQDKLSPSEAVLGFAGWLTSRDEKTVMSSTDDAACIADLVNEFCKTNNLDDPKDHWEDNLTHPDQGNSKMQWESLCRATLPNPLDLPPL